MSTPASELYERLRRPFQSYELEWRVSRSGNKNGNKWAIVVPYVQRPAIVNRLNQVCGIDGWASDTRIVTPSTLPAQGEQPPMPIGHVAVGVGIRVEGEWVWRWDGTGLLEPDPPHFVASDAGKGDFSNAFKRAAEQLGIGVYLRELRGPYFAQFDQEGRYRNKIDGEWLRWNPPSIEGTPDWPGELVDRTVPTSATPDPAGEADKDQIQKDLEARQKQQEDARLVDDYQAQVGRFMKANGFYSYHLEALILTHKDLKMRFQTVEQLKSAGSAEDWSQIVALTKRGQQRWDEAPKELAQEFPTSEERVELLRRLIGDKKPSNKETVIINAAIESGWNDAVEYWINTLYEREAA